jgi:hypothetical protein
MSLRIIVRDDDAGMACNVGGAVHTSFRTFVIEAPEVEAFLRASASAKNSYLQRQIAGVELIDVARVSSQHGASHE